MTAINTRRKFSSDICIAGKRIGTMRQIAKAIFRDSFLSIEVKMPDRVFVLRLDHRIDRDMLKDFTDKHRLCKVIVYKEMKLSDLR